MTEVLWKEGTNQYIGMDGNHYVLVEGMAQAYRFGEGKALGMISSFKLKLRGNLKVVPLQEEEDPPFFSDGLLEKIRGICAFEDSLRAYMFGLRAGLRKVQAEILDIEHCIELLNFNTDIGYYLCKLLQTARRKRRRLKDTLGMITRLAAAKGGKELLATATERQRPPACRTYTPRACKWLFGPKDAVTSEELNELYGCVYEEQE
jgi:hypothetical protein